jgi:L-fucono-1,5-lactonase
MPKEKIDAHHHLWRYDAAEYGWIGPEMKALARDFLPQDLELELISSGIAGTVVVQARQSLEETRWLLSIADKSQMIRGVVGWADLCSVVFATQLQELSAAKKLKGLRHVVQDEPDDNFLNGPEFSRGIALLAGTGMVYDILIYERQLATAIEFVDRHPNQKFVLDHIAKPQIRTKMIEPWRTQIQELAQRESVFCKLSGMVTEASWTSWTIDDLRPYFDVVLDAFGPSRLMAGSDWPVCLLASTYQRWLQTLEQLTAQLSESERESIFGGVAAQVYRLHENDRQ